MKTRFDGGWQYDPSIGGGAYCYYAPGDYDDRERMVPEYTIPSRALRQLIPLLEADGLLVPHLDKAVRVEDLKITHRLIDIVSALTEPRP